MRFLPLLVLGSFNYLDLVVADRISNAHDTPTVSNNAPDDTGAAIIPKRTRRGYNGHAHAELVHDPLLIRDLSKRSGVVTYDENCNGPLPNNSGYKPRNGFNTMKDVLEKAYANVLELADKGASIGQDSLAFTHYFGGTKTNDQYTHFKNMMSAIKSDPQAFNIQFECSGTTNDCASAQRSVAVADGTTGQANTQKVVNICAPFWTVASTKFLLWIDHPDGTRPEVPYRDKTASGWCTKDRNGNAKQRCDWFATAVTGHTILHELTHLDTLGNQAGLDAPTDGNDMGRHGTDDAQKGAALPGARDHLAKYKADDSNASPDYNAESYAAAATEAYFMELCGFNEIPPLIGPPAVATTSTPSASPSASATAAASPPPPPYATGICSFHLQEWQDCADDSKNLFAIVNMLDNNKNSIGDTPTGPGSPLGAPINAADPYSFTSKLPMPLGIVGEHQHDYVQFTYGNLQWTSRTTDGPAKCSNGGWDPRSGSICNGRFHQNAVCLIILSSIYISLLVFVAHSD